MSVYVDEEVYFVFNPRAEKPKIRHKTFESARTEACRLANEQQGEKFFVLKAVVSYKRPPVQMIFKQYASPRPIKTKRQQTCVNGYGKIVKLFKRHKFINGDLLP